MRTRGFQLLASRLVFDGRLPYVDFMYNQMPLLPYVHELWMKPFGFNWYAARVLSALLATALRSLLHAPTRCHTQGERGGWRLIDGRDC